MFKGKEIQPVNKFRFYVADMDWSDRLREATEGLGWSKAELARRSGIAYDSVNKYLRGDIAQPRGDVMDKLARAVGKDTRWLRDGDDSTPTTLTGDVNGPILVSSARLPYAGVVQAGAFLLLDDYFNQDDSDQMVPLGVAPHPEFMKIRQGAWQARGDSMNIAKPPILDGMWIVAGDYSDYVDKIGELGNGSYVVVERVTDGGSKRERTVKEVQFARRGMRLIPHSSNTAYKEFFIPLDAEADSDTEMVHILAVVLWAGWDMDPRSR